ncbi:sugar phosphate isomerase/epimerase [Clostridium sp. SYSU_GA19001]|uniref:sugar phosphate isomerase/epimerase family protein n=1 Tax=Clostridium caldaquaticum TaxID=2940653 RepID=UPI0020772938|nr:sugar phosphate isomerase/epimerase [Clostridium caldaquaticum]MCM8709948.1 sugar phosphate isomerase/epimerase [Clostridium caldaquaticum]
MGNLKYSYQTNMWGLMVQYPKINNWSEFYKGDFSNSVYYLDWDQIIKYHVGAGFKGIELMFHMQPYIEQFFGEAKKFTEFVQQRGIEEVTGTFSIAFNSQDKSLHKSSLENAQKIIDFTADLGGKRINIMPCGGYYGLGPLSKEQVENCAVYMNEFGRRCADKGIIPCVHTEFWGAINKNELERYIELLDPDYVGFCLDTAQVLIMGFDPVEMYDKYHDFVKYFHLKDTTFAYAPDELRLKAGAEFQDNGDRWFWEIGAGKVDFVGLWHKLKKHQYKGWIGVETDGTPDPMATMLLSKYYINHVLSPIYE